jgi:signal transduction histidine kinase/YHS domain-containing protein
LNDWFHVSFIAIVLLVASNLWLLFRVLRPLQRLAAQTADLSKGHFAAFQQPCGGIDEIGVLQRSMASMAGHVRRAQQEDHAYRHAQTNGQEAERARIAHELHDDAVQSLIAIAQSIELASNWIEKDRELAVTTLKLARRQAVETVENLRRMIANLRPPALEELGLVPALQMLTKDVPAVSIAVKTEGVARRLEEAQELTLFRCVQEAIRNAQKHSRATQVLVEVSYQPTEVGLAVTDNGIGFQMPERLDCLAEEEHYGLLGIYERVHSLNGTVHITSASGQGTMISIHLPLAVSIQPAETVRDPVCGALIHPQQAYGSVVLQQQRYYFCCPVCQGAFQRSPETYLISVKSNQTWS